MPPAYENQVRRIIDEQIGVLSRSAQINLEEIKDKFLEMNTYIRNCQNSWDSCAQEYDVKRLYKELGAVSERLNNLRDDIRQLHDAAGTDTKRDGSIFTELAEVRGNFMEVMVEVSDLQSRTEVLELRSTGTVEKTRDENKSSSSNIVAVSSLSSSTSSSSNLDVSGTSVEQGEGKNNEIFGIKGVTRNLSRECVSHCVIAIAPAEDADNHTNKESLSGDCMESGDCTESVKVVRCSWAALMGCFSMLFFFGLFLVEVLKIKELQERAPREIVFCS